jgi:hypothetical protein
MVVIDGGEDDNQDSGEVVLVMMWRKRLHDDANGVGGVEKQWRITTIEVVMGITR